MSQSDDSGGLTSSSTEQITVGEAVATILACVEASVLLLIKCFLDVEIVFPEKNSRAFI